MTHYLFMNHRIKENPPSGPVIMCLSPEGLRESNEFEIFYRGQPIGRVKFDRDGLDKCETHHVKAWVELEDDVEVLMVARAAAKKPKRKVKAK